jgi:hypothetical protein
MAAAVLAQGDEFGGMGGFGGGQSSNPSSMQAGGDSMYPQLQFQHHERTLGLMDSAQQPQLPGRLLQVSDIKPDLQVRTRFLLYATCQLPAWLLCSWLLLYKCQTSSRRCVEGLSLFTDWLKQLSQVRWRAVTVYVWLKQLSCVVLGLMDSVQQPQLLGRLLQVSDIKPDLQVCTGGCLLFSCTTSVGRDH